MKKVNFTEFSPNSRSFRRRSIVRQTRILLLAAARRDSDDNSDGHIFIGLQYFKRQV